MAQRRKSSNDTDLWDSQWQKRRFVWTRVHTAFAIFAVLGVLLVIFIGWRYFSYGPESPQEAQTDFYNYVFELMEEYKPRYALFDSLADPAALLQGDHWEIIDLAAEAPDEPVRQLLGEGCVIRTWEDLKQAEAERLWLDWQSAERYIRRDVFIITELSLHIEYQNLPALQENSWLVQNARGDKYLLVHANGRWGVKLMAWFR